jgi:hypothetical protein
LIFLLQSYGKKRLLPTFFLVFSPVICDSIVVLRQTGVDVAICVAKRMAIIKEKTKKIFFCFVLRSLIRTFAPYNIEEGKNGLHTTYRDKYKCLFGSRFGERTVHL